MDGSRWKQVEALYHAALKLEPSARDRFVLEACEDEELRREVASLLAQDVSGDGILDRPVWEAAPDLLTEDARPREADYAGMTGRTIDQYLILEKLGEGGMGVVYKAKDSNLGRTVALKFIASQFAGSEEHKQRFLREAKATAAIDHPNICMVHSVGESEGRIFLAMAYIAGEELAAKIKQRPLKLEDALTIAIEAGEGLREAHIRGVVHRDVKSSNLMLTSSGQVKVMDFGLAQLAGGTRVTKSDTVLGTPAYMSPEQAQRLPTDRRTDIWSLGVVLYEMLTGRPPFEGDHELSVIYSIINEPHEPITALRAGMPLELDRILSKTLAKSPEERYQHLDDMLVDLRALRGAPASGSRATVPARPNRRTAVWSGIGALAAVAALGFGWDWRGGGGMGGAVSPLIASIAVLPLENFSGAQDQQYLSDGLTDGLIAELAKVGELRVTSRTSAMLYRGSDKPLPRIAEELGVDAVVEGSAQKFGDSIRVTVQLIDAKTDELLWAESYDRKLADVLALQREIARTVAGKIAVVVTPEESNRLADARKVNPEAYEAYLRGRFYLDSFTARDFDTALQYFQIALEDDPSSALAYAGIAEVWGHRVAGGQVPPLEAGPRWTEAAEKAVELDDTLAEAHGALANLEWVHRWDWPAAEVAFRRAIELNPNNAYVHTFYSHLLTCMGRAEEAAPHIERAVELDPLNPFIQGLYGIQLMLALRFDEAVARFRHMLRMAPGFPLGHSGLWVCLHEKGRFEEAMAEAQALYAGDPGVSEALVRGYARAGYPEAMNAAGDVLAARSKTTFVRPVSVGLLYEFAGNVEKSIEWYERGFEVRDHEMVYLNAGPMSEAIRRHPRFQELLRKMNFPE